MKGFKLPAFVAGSAVALAALADCSSSQATPPPASGWEQKEFIITMWSSPLATEENLVRLEREGFTLTNVSFGRNDERIPDADALKLLDNVDKCKKIKALFGNDRTPFLRRGVLDDPAKKAQLDEFIDTVKRHPSFAGYWLADEPDGTTFADWGRLVRYLRERDPEHLAYVNLLPMGGTQERMGVFLKDLKEPPKGNVGIPDNLAGVGAQKQNVQLYNKYLDEFVAKVNPRLLSYDHYHFLRDGKDGKRYFLNLELMRAAALKAGLPFLNIVQACPVNAGQRWRMPNEDELRWLAYTTMAYGGRGISWFLYSGPAEYGGLYQNGRRMPAADWVAGINQEIKALGPELMKLNTSDVYHSEPLPLGAQGMEKSPVKASGGQYIVGTFKEDGRINAFMLMNRDYKAKSVASVSVSLGHGELLGFSVPHGKWEKVGTAASGSVIRVELPPGGGRLFKMAQ